MKNIVFKDNTKINIVILSTHQAGVLLNDL